MGHARSARSARSARGDLMSAKGSVRSSPLSQTDRGGYAEEHKHAERSGGSLYRSSVVAKAHDWDPDLHSGRAVDRGP